MSTILVLIERTKQSAFERNTGAPSKIGNVWFKAPSSDFRSMKKAARAHAKRLAGYNPDTDSSKARVKVNKTRRVIAVELATDDDQILIDFRRNLEDALGIAAEEKKLAEERAAKSGVLPFPLAVATS